MRAAFVHILDDNVGDRASGPYHYFDFGRPGEADELEFINVRDDFRGAAPVDFAVFGGGAIGGLLRGSKHMGMRAKYRIAWGIGRTVRDSTDHQPMPQYFDLLGNREWGSPWGEYVPCASCMHPLFDADYEITREAILFYNANRRVNVRDVEAVEVNRGTMEDVIPFLASAETVVTNSYHGAYWGTLLGRKVVLASPYSSKFHHYQHQPPAVYDDNWRAADARAYPEALALARARNVAFHEKVMDMVHGRDCA